MPVILSVPFNYREYVGRSIPRTGANGLALDGSGRQWPRILQSIRRLVIYMQPGSALSPPPPQEAEWWSDINPDDSRIRIRLRPEYVRALAWFVGESTSYQESVRMAVSQGAMLLSADEPPSWTCPPDMDDIPEPRVKWYLDDEDLHGPEDVNRKVLFTPVLLEKLAVAAPEYPSVGEAARRCINAALADRDRGK
jgi:hypothetical protein